MHDIVVRPTRKFVGAAYVASLVVIAAGFIVQQSVVQQGPWWAPFILAVLLVWTAVRHVRRLAVKVTITADKLRYESGFLSKSTRTIQLAKVQDVRVDQNLGQRIFGVGSLAIETAGESSRLVLTDIDSPQAIADEIVRRSELATTGHGI